MCQVCRIRNEPSRKVWPNIGKNQNIVNEIKRPLPFNFIECIRYRYVDTISTSYAIITISQVRWNAIACYYKSDDNDIDIDNGVVVHPPANRLALKLSVFPLVYNRKMSKREFQFIVFTCSVHNRTRVAMAMMSMNPEILEKQNKHNQNKLGKE